MPRIPAVVGCSVRWSLHGLTSCDANSVRTPFTSSGTSGKSPTNLQIIMFVLLCTLPHGRIAAIAPKIVALLRRETSEVLFALSCGAPRWRFAAGAGGGNGALDLAWVAGIVVSTAGAPGTGIPQVSVRNGIRGVTGLRIEVNGDVGALAPSREGWGPHDNGTGPIAPIWVPRHCLRVDVVVGQLEPNMSLTLSFRRHWTAKTE
ncbi:hypothetical protein B0T16DRAFT_225659 [Cercophora newfieldiana]|uniref:Uncharacterized protein n=1 Tax=Cercophora newfieldiana TaxID=92897 RepID=A0AA40CM92_9PEZI|nr:hypothetical protein B0T16DRAFT_225659 [Cercophora newfieldiana]